MILRTEDVRIVLRETADAHEAVQRAGPFVAVHGAQFEQPHGQLTIRTLPGIKDEAVHGAVHGLGVVDAVVHLHGRVHTVFVEAQMAGRFEQLGVGQMRCVGKLVSAVGMTLAGVVLHGLANDGALGVPHRQAAAEEFGREAE